MTEDIIDKVAGEKLSSVTFVMDYLQLDFDGNGFTINIWPTVVIADTDYKFFDDRYRNMLCSLITEVVKEIIVEESFKMVIEFETGNQIIISLDPTNPEIITPEILIFTSADGKWAIY